MRIGILLRAPAVWGAERSLLTLLGTAVAKGNDITVIVAVGSPLKDHLRSLGVRFVEYEFVEHASLKAGGLQHASVTTLFRDAFSIFRSGVRLARLLGNFDCVVSFGLWETCEIALASRLARVPCVYDFHVTFDSRIGRLVLRLVLKLVTAVIAPSRATYKQAGIQKSGPLLEVVARPVSVVKASKNVEVQGAQQKLRVGVFGQVDPRKAILETVEALKGHARVLELWVVGCQAPEKRSAYERTVIHTLSEVGEGWRVFERLENPYELMGRCDVVLNAAHHEAFGRTVVEAIQVGAIPVVLAGGGPEEIIEDTGFGYVARDLKELVEVLVSLHKKRANGQEISIPSYGVLSTTRRYSPEAVAERYFGFLSDIANGEISKVSQIPSRHDKSLDN